MSTPVYSTPSYSAPSGVAPAVVPGTIVPDGKTYGEETPAEESTVPSAGLLLSPPLPSLESQETSLIEMIVPEEAVVFLNEQKMTSVGSVRNFISPKLTGNGPYFYHIRIDLPQSGENLTLEHRQLVEKGGKYELAFKVEDGALVLVSPQLVDKLASR